MTVDTITTEAVFYSSSYTTKSGWKGTFQFPDGQAARAFDAIGAGKRYMLVAAPIADDETPDKDAMAKVPKSPAQMAGILCNDVRFWAFLGTSYGHTCFLLCKDAVIETNSECVDVLREILRIDSRSEIKEGTDVCSRFEALRTDFDIYTGRIAAPR